jgi:hypothetical protein
MFGDPVAMVAEAVGQAGKLDGIVQGVGRRKSGGHRRLVDY